MFTFRLLAIALAVIVTSGPAWAQGLGLGVGSNHTLYHPGDRLDLSVSAVNTGGPGVADFYTGVILPDGITIATIGPGGEARLGTLGAPAAFCSGCRGHQSRRALFGVGRPAVPLRLDRW